MAWVFSSAAPESVEELKRVAEHYAWIDAYTLDVIEAQYGSLPTSNTSREVLSSLLSLQSFPSEEHLVLFVVVLSRVYRVLYCDTLRRKRRLAPAVSSTTAEASPLTDDTQLVRDAKATMNAWARDAVPLLFHRILPQLSLRDVETVTMKAQHQLTQPLSTHHESKSMDGSSEDNTAAQRLYAALVSYAALPQLVELIRFIQQTSNVSLLTPLAMAAYGALHSNQLSPLQAPESATCRCSKMLQRWWSRLLRDLDDGVADGVVPAADALAPCALERCFDALEEVLLLSAGGKDDAALLSIAFTFLQPEEFPDEAGAAILNANVERGAVPSPEQAAALLHSREEALAALTILPAEMTAEAVPNSSVAHSSLEVEGALFLVARVFRKGRSGLPYFYSASPTSFFLSTVESFTVALESVSGAALLRHLLFLHDCVSAVPKYSITCAGEGSAGLPTGLAVTSCDRCLTRKYDALFSIVQRLLTLSAVCPSAPHRRLARHIGLELLERLQEAPRLRLHCSLLKLCPYSSITRFFLESLLREWRVQLHGEAAEARPNSHHQVAISTFDGYLPATFGDCLDTFLQHLWAGEKEFLDPLIVGLNFIFVELRLRQRPGSTGGAGLPYRWAGLLTTVKTRILPRCSKLLNLPQDASRDSAGPPSSLSSPPSWLSIAALSPLEHFSLSNAIEGLKPLLVELKV